MVDDWELMEKISEELKDDPVIVSRAISANGYSLFEQASGRLKADKEFVTSILNDHPSALIHATEELRGDKELVMTAFKSGGELFLNTLLML